ncbi:MAG: Zn-dependent protease [Phycisphaerales bacterium]|nr:MAG: Zn-dependent protease [Phycisphaerales bacterium]
MDEPLRTMDFFGQQDRARKRTGLLVFLYVLAVTLTCAAVAGLAVLIAVLLVEDDAGNPPEPHMLALFAGGGALAAALLIAFGTAYRLSELRSGGASVALSLGGEPIQPVAPRNDDERMVLNVVEEMAIASGVPVPPVYVLADQPTINAFAAGYGPSDAVIGVTRGCVHGLTRDEFQGVMAHEFSHILNGDMRLNTRLLGVLGGIVMLSLAGYTIVRSMRYVSSSSRRDKNNGAAIILILGVGLIVIGGIGSVFARLIQAAVSRQREFLADASAVQFTRNPLGIGNALRRIAGTPRRSAISNAHARETSHMFFGDAVGSKSPFASLLASHPPLAERIRRILPDWDGTVLEPLHREAARTATDRSERSGAPSAADRLHEALRARMGDRGSAAAAAAGVAPLLALIGSATAQHAEHARTLLDRLPSALRQAAGDPYASRAVVYALLIDWGDPGHASAQLGLLEAHADQGVAGLVRSLAGDARELPDELRLPLIDLCLATLASLSQPQYARFRETLDRLALANDHLSLREWALLRIVQTHLDERFGMADHRQAVRYYGWGRLGFHVSVVLRRPGAGHAPG